MSESVVCGEQSSAGRKFAELAEVEHRASRARFAAAGNSRTTTALVVGRHDLLEWLGMRPMRILEDSPLLAASNVSTKAVREKVMRIGIVSDTHGQVTYALDGVRMLETFEVAAVLHCGDIGSPKIVPLFAAWPTHFVFGNVDEPSSLRDAIADAGQSCHERFGDFELHGKRIALLHGDDGRKFREVTHANEFDLVCYGHTHVAKQERIGRTLVLNPGALYRADPHTIAIVDLATLTAEMVAV